MRREAIVQTGPSPGDDTADLAIGILRADQGSYMSRLPLGFVLAFDCGREGEGGEVGNTRGGACSRTTATKTNTTTTTNTTTRRMGRVRAEERMTGGNPTKTVVTSSASNPSAA